MSRTWNVDYGKIRPGMSPGRYALAMRRLAKRRRMAATATERKGGEASGKKNPSADLE